MDIDRVDARLRNDCHDLGVLLQNRLLLQRNATLPWFIVVPDTGLPDLLDLPATQRDRVVQACAEVSGFIKQVLGFSKVNFAGLGNQVAQMHLHIIGRREGDACWPQPVWGRLPEGEGYTPQQLVQWQQQLAEHSGLVAPGAVI